MEAAEAANDGQPVEGAAKRDSDSEESVDLEVESDASETTVSRHVFILGSAGLRLLCFIQKFIQFQVCTHYTLTCLLSSCALQKNRAIVLSFCDLFKILGILRGSDFCTQ